MPSHSNLSSSSLGRWHSRFYFLLFAYPLWISQQSIPPWLLILIFLAIGVAAYQLPGTIILTSDRVLQRFWLRKQKELRYNQITAIHAARAGAVIRVVGPHGAMITHTFNHAGSMIFCSELALRSGREIVQ